MPNCFTLTRKNNLDAGPVALSEIDNEICAYLGVEPWEDEYYRQWVDTIGLALACGQSFDQIIEQCRKDMGAYIESSHYYEIKMKIAEYLNQHFVADAWSACADRKL
jgi:hypothetical protein